MDIQNQLNSVFEELSKQVQDTVTQELSAYVKDQVARFDLKSLIRDQVNEYLDARIKEYSFPEQSIPANTIKFDGFVLSGDHVQAGIIKNFGSTGIDDQASNCQLTILDTHIVMEPPLVTTGVDVRGDVAISGNLTLTGKLNKDGQAYNDLLTDTLSAVQKNINEELFKGFSDIISADIHRKGINFSEVLINGKLALAETKLGPSVIHSNLRKVGELDELQVKGETFLSSTVYVSNKRVGINTIEPSLALAVWDEDVEILVGKKSQGHGFIGTNRRMPLTLSANGKENISLDVDGSVTINDLRLGALPISTASIQPTWEGRAGEIVFNDSPGIGKPIGWVCLEGHRWGNFGIIQG